MVEGWVADYPSMGEVWPGVDPVGVLLGVQEVAYGVLEDHH